MDLLDHLVAEDVVAVEHLDGADGAGAGVAGVLHLGEAALPDGLADLVRAHPRLPPRRRGLRHPSGGGRARTGGRRGRSHEEADRQGARDEAPRLAGFVCVGACSAGSTGHGTGGIWLWAASSAPRACGFIKPRRWVTLRWWARSRSVLFGETRGVRRTEAPGGRAWVGLPARPRRRVAAWIGLGTGTAGTAGRTGLRRACLSLAHAHRASKQPDGTAGA